MYSKNNKKNIINELLMLFITSIVFAFLFSLIVFFTLNFKTNGLFKYLNVFFLSEPPNFEQTENDIFKASTNNSTTIPLKDITFPSNSAVFGKISIESRGLSCPLIYGDDDDCLSRGAGMYIGSKIPGYGGTCLVAGHNTSYFRKLRTVEIGDIISVVTTYGVYEYKVYNIDVFPDNDKKAYDFVTDEQILDLYTCYYVNTPVGNVKERLFIYSKLISGPIIIK
ncbi:MAG: class D sortase [Clostridia bacterium]